MTQLKRGKLSKDDLSYIETHMDTSGAAEIAQQLQRSEAFIQKTINRLAVTTDKGVEDATLAALHNSYYWEQLQLQLIGKEVSYFEKAWIELSKQFSQHGIMASDEIAIKDLIQHEIHANRAVTKKAEHIREISELERLIAVEHDIDPDARNQGLLAQWETQRSALIAAMDALTGEALEYNKKKDEKLKQLKATRESRLKNAEQSKSNFWALMREMNTPDKLKSWIEYCQKMHLGAHIVRLEWGELIEFEDGKFDRPFISPEGEQREMDKNKEN